MTVGIGVASRSGLVVVTDSRRTARLASSPPQYVVETDDAQKLFVIEKRLAIATFGQAVIDGETVGTLLEKFHSQTTCSDAGLPAEVGAWFSAQLQAAMQPRRGDLVNHEDMGWPLGFVVGAYHEGVGQLVEVRVRPGDFEIEKLAPSTENPGVYPFGQTDGIDRLLTGIDRRAMRRAGFQFSPGDQEKLALLSYDLIVPEALDEAGELAEALVGVQLLAQRFSLGTYVDKGDRVPGCGGEIRTVCITSEGAQWTSGEPSSPQAGQVPLLADEAPQHVRLSA